MMQPMNRAEAIRILVDRKLKTLAPDARRRLLQGSPKADELLLRHRLAGSFIGVQNSYLIEEVSKLIQDQVTVTDGPENLFACRCCHYQTLQQRAENEICSVCYWEDDGTIHAASTSWSNQMQLGDA